MAIWTWLRSAPSRPHVSPRPITRQSFRIRSSKGAGNHFPVPYREPDTSHNPEKSLPRQWRFWGRFCQTRGLVGCLSWRTRETGGETFGRRKALRELALQRKKPRLLASASFVNPWVAFYFAMGVEVERTGHSSKFKRRQKMSRALITRNRVTKSPLAGYNSGGRNGTCIRHAGHVQDGRRLDAAAGRGIGAAHPRQRPGGRHLDARPRQQVQRGVRPDAARR